RQFAIERGVRWTTDAQRRMMGMSSLEWAAYMHDELGVALEPGEIIAGVVDEMASRYRAHLPLLPGAVDAVRRLANRWPLAIASSANRPLIDLVLDEADLAGCFAVTLSTEEVGRGKPAPDVYLEAARRLAVTPARCSGVEDSSNGLRALRANRDFPPDADALALADVVLSDLSELTVDVIDP
ncbi:MAG: HAD family phosphatase, partial [Actinobacteria bacterium]